MKATKKNYEILSNKYNPWKEQIVLEFNDGTTWVIELMKDDKEFYLFAGPKGSEAKGLRDINEKVWKLIEAKALKEIYIDSL